MEATALFGQRAAKALKGQEFAMIRSRRFRRMFADFDFSAFLALLFGTQVELKPIPVKVRRRR